jgi:CBS domain-containing protein
MTVVLRDIATRDVRTAAPDDPIDEAIRSMEERGIHHLPVASGRKVVGMLSDRDILIAVGWLPVAERDGAEAPPAGPHQVSQIMSREVISLSPDATLKEAATLIVKHKIGALPLIEGDHLVGLVTETDLVRALRDMCVAAEEDSACFQPIRKGMSSPVLSIGPSQKLEEATRLFQARGIRHLAVVEDGRLAGMVSDRDIRRALGRASVLDQQAEREGTMLVGGNLIKDVMTEEVISADPNTTWCEAAHVMIGERIHSLVVLENELLVGIITPTDLIRLITRMDL